MRKPRSAALVALALLASCRADPIDRERTGAGGAIKLDTLFEAHGCTMYRFVDGGEAHYWANCPGVVSSERTEHRACGERGRTCPHTEVHSIQTTAEPRR